MGLMRTVILFVLGIIGTILISVFERILAKDVEEWLPWIVRRLIERAISRLPEDQRERFEEEWRSHVNETPGNLAKICVAWGCVSASKTINRLSLSGETLSLDERIQEAMRRVIDIVSAVALLYLFLPLFAIVSLCIKCESRGPVLLHSECVGRNGRVFKLLLFRVVQWDYTDSSDSTQNTKLRGARMTRIGSFLWLSGMARLPLFLNLLRGDITLVGPTPLSSKLYHEIQEKIQEPQFQCRTTVKPGITGWAQINYDGCIMHMVSCDEYYMQRRSLGFDVRIIIIALTKLLTDHIKRK